MASAVAAMRGRIFRAFAKANAFSETDAKNIAELGLRPVGPVGIFNRMVQNGNIIKTADGRFYMDKAFYDAHVQRRKIVLPILAGVFVVCGIIGIILYLMR
jgi:hypothetical protein